MAGEQYSIRGLLSPQWKAAIRRNLRHRIDIVRADAPNMFGEPTEGATLNVPCFISNQTSRQVNSQSQNVTVSYSVVFPPNIDVKVNDTLRNGRVRDGRVVLPEGKVINVSDDLHVMQGVVTQRASVMRA